MPLNNNDPVVALRTAGHNLLALVEYGSRAYGTVTAASDRDLFGVYVEHDRQIYGLESADTLVYRLNVEGDLKQIVTDHPQPSAPSDIEMILHPLRKYVALAAAGNPAVLSTLWTPPELSVVRTIASELLFAHRDSFLSKHAGFRHAGYARAQRDALLGRANRRTNRPGLIEQHGYDTKYAAHLIRLLFAGLDLVRERTFHLPMKPEQLELLVEIRQGDLVLDDVVTLSEKLEQELTAETEDSDLPDSVDYVAINDLLYLVRNEHLDRIAA